MGWIPNNTGGGPPGVPGPTGPTGSAGVGVTASYDCPAGVAVNDLVYEDPVVDSVDRANATNVSKMPAIGFVISKPTAITCVIQFMGQLSGFVGLTPDVQYYADTTNGGITTTAPSGFGSGKVVQKVGIARNATTLNILIDGTLVVL